MPRIHYFQRYSSVENTVTNNTLLLFARIQNHSNTVASKLLSDLTNEEIEIGVQFLQQGREEKSVPDGQIIQDSFKILIEAKVGAGVNHSQIIAHCASFNRESVKIMLLLTKQTVGAAEQAEINAKIREIYKGITFVALTFKDIYESIEDLYPDHEPEMQELVRDYQIYCHETNLLDKSDCIMRVVPCSESIHLNKKYGMYFQKSHRGYTPHTFLGIYSQKAVQLIWKSDSVFDVEYIYGELVIHLVEGEKTEEFNERIINMIHDAREQCGYEISTGHRFFITRNVVETNYIKRSRGGIQGHRIHDLSPYLDGKNLSVEDIAQILRDNTWS